MQLFKKKGQKFLHCPGTEGQRYKLKIFPWDESSRDSLSKSGMGCTQSLFFKIRDIFFLWFPVLSLVFLLISNLSNGLRLHQFLGTKTTVLEHPFLLCPVLSRVPSRILAVPARPVPDFSCPGPSRPLVRFWACPVVPLSRDNEETSVPLSRKVVLSRPVGNPNTRLPSAVCSLKRLPQTYFDKYWISPTENQGCIYLWISFIS